MIVVLAAVNSCIESYTPGISTNDSEKIVVNGAVTDETEYQVVCISRSSSIAAPSYIPVSGCDVKITDNRGNLFQYREDGEGIYTGYINSEFLYEGAAFKIDIVTPDGQFISSEFDTLHSCPEIDSVYYIQESILTPDPTFNIEGIQFYVDYNGGSSKSKYIKWGLYETWEYHARFPKKWYIDYGTGVKEIDPPDYSLNRCWNTAKINNIFALSTSNLAENRYSKFPLHYVDNRTQRLAYGYSLLVKQYSLSRQAYEYYNKIQLVINKEGGLYNSQPFGVEGNLMNLTNPNEVVLGFFYAGGLKTKRIFVSPIEGLHLEYDYLCTFKNLEKVGLKAVRHDDYPAYLWLEGGLYWIWENCYNCECAGGTMEKPTFWKSTT